MKSLLAWTLWPIMLREQSQFCCLSQASAGSATALLLYVRGCSACQASSTSSNPAMASFSS